MGLGMQRRVLAITLAVAAGISQMAEARAFPGLTQGGPSGLVLVPTGQVLDSNWYAVGLHRGILKASYGLLGYIETGASLPDLFDELDSREKWYIRWGREVTFFMKVGHKFSPSRWWIPGVAVGAENSLRRSAETLGLATRRTLSPSPKPEFRRSAETLYFTGSWGYRLGSWPMETTVGVGTGRFFNQIFVGIGVIPKTLFGNTLKFIGEYAGKKADIGARFALSKNLRLDFVVLMDTFGTGPEAQRWSIKVQRGLLGASKASRADWRNVTRIFGLKKKRAQKSGRTTHRD